MSNDSVSYELRQA